MFDMLILDVLPFVFVQGLMFQPPEAGSSAVCGLSPIYPISYMMKLKLEDHSLSPCRKSLLYPFDSFCAFDLYI